MECSWPKRRSDHGRAIAILRNEANKSFASNMCAVGKLRKLRLIGEADVLFSISQSGAALGMRGVQLQNQEGLESACTVVRCHLGKPKLGVRTWAQDHAGMGGRRW
jgi:hypothetical protein